MKRETIRLRDQDQPPRDMWRQTCLEAICLAGVAGVILGLLLARFVMI